MKTPPSLSTPNETAACGPQSPAARRWTFYYPGRIRVPHYHSTQPSRTRQEFKDECDINRIMANYQITGAINHFSKYSSSYGDFSACDFQEAQNLVIRARKMFDELPNNVKAHVSTPEGFLAFVQNPANAEKMAELGLRPREDLSNPSLLTAKNPTQNEPEGS